MPSSVAQRIKQTRQKIGRIRAALTEIEYLCSGVGAGVDPLSFAGEVSFS
jgi:hypothetical protein